MYHGGCSAEIGERSFRDMIKSISFILGISAGLFFCVGPVPGFLTVSSADTVILKDGKRAKGLILDEFKDRIVLSTVEGEKTIMKSDIQSAVYDSEQKALLQKGRNQIKKGQYIKAYYTYKKAVELDPDLEEASQRLHYLRNYLERKTRQDVNRSIRDRKERFENVAGVTPAQRVAGELGLVLAQGDKYVFIKKITDSLSREDPELMRDDRIVAVWGEMTAYMDVEEVADMLLSSGEVRLTIERTVVPRLSSYRKMLFGCLPFGGYEKVIGAGLKLRRRGVIIDNLAPGGPFERAGIRSGDLLYRINGRNTRYLPMSRIVDIINKKQNGEIEIVIRRDTTLWRKEQGI